MSKQEKIQEHKKLVNMIFQPLEYQDVVKKIDGMSSDEIIAELSESNLRGRGGAGFPTGLKWQFCKKAPGKTRYVVCNADEGEPGTFKDRQILQEVPGKVLAGMYAAAKAVGAKEGFVYLRAEYNYLLPDLMQALEDFNKSVPDFTVHMRSGSGAYICGEETALIESLEGNRGEARNKPPYPVTEGYLGNPTVVNNVETLVYAAMVIHNGADTFKKMGTEFSTGAKVFCISGDAAVEGIYELEMGMSLKEFDDLFGTGDTKAVQVGGASGNCVPRRKFEETLIGFEGVPTGGSMMVFGSNRSMYHILRNYLSFFREESCGQCTPCRVGCQQLLKGIEAVKKGEKPGAYLDKLIELAKAMRISSKCGLGQSVANPFISIVENFKEEIMY